MKLIRKAERYLVGTIDQEHEGEKLPDALVTIERVEDWPPTILAPSVRWEYYVDRCYEGIYKTQEGAETNALKKIEKYDGRVDELEQSAKPRTIYEQFAKSPFAAPCPFCGLREALVCQEKEVWWLQCTHCKARGPEGRSKHEAHVAWDNLDGVKPRDRVEKK